MPENPILLFPAATVSARAGRQSPFPQNRQDLATGDSVNDSRVSLARCSSDLGTSRPI